MIVYLDTNFLLIPGQFNLDIFAELDRIMEVPYELAITPLVESELSALSEGKSKDARAAKLAIQLIKAQGIKTRPKSSEGEAFKNADDELVSLAREQDIVATQDRELRTRLAANKVRVIMMRSKKALAFV